MAIKVKKEELLLEQELSEKLSNGIKNALNSEIKRIWFSI